MINEDLIKKELVGSEQQSAMARDDLASRDSVGYAVFDGHWVGIPKSRNMPSDNALTRHQHAYKKTHSKLITQCTNSLGDSGGLDHPFCHNSRKILAGGLGPFCM